MKQFESSIAAGNLLRVSLGVMYLTHSLLLKVATYGFDGTAQYFESIGLPGALAYFTIVAEAAGGVLLIAGYKARETALLLVPILVGALWAHSGNGWVFTNAGGGWEYPLFLIAVSVAVALNPGRQLAVGAARVSPQPATLVR
ncbi:MAG TPA: DoxX family protein [Gammaproteobacteria bacterium]|nr:DoxX family protein [Gammaproteobacteria bacterium]